MKIQQKMIQAIGTRNLTCEVNEHLEEGWRVQAGSIVRGNGDTMVCVVECDVPERLPKPSHEAHCNET